MNDANVTTGPELVALFNSRVEAIHALGRGGAWKPVKRFASVEDGVKRCEKIAEALKVAQESPNPDGAIAETKTPNGGGNSAPVETEQETTVAKETTKKRGGAKAAAPKKAKAPKAESAKKAKDTKPRMAEPFEMVRAGTNRALAIAKMLKAGGSSVKMASMLTAVYGAEAAASGEYNGTINMVLKGIAKVVIDHKLPFKFEKSKDESGALCVALIPKK